MQGVGAAQKMLRGVSMHMNSRSMSYQQVVLIGNLGKDPVFKAFENQTEATMFSSGEEPAEKKGIYRFPLATSKSGKKQDGTFATTTTWHQVSTTNPAYGNKLKTGDRVLVQGEIKNWSNENAHGSLIVVQRLVMLNSKAKEAEIGPDGHQAPE